MYLHAPVFSSNKNIKSREQEAKSLAQESCRLVLLWSSSEASSEREVLRRCGCVGGAEGVQQARSVRGRVAGWDPRHNLPNFCADGSGSLARQVNPPPATEGKSFLKMLLSAQHQRSKGRWSC